jgi:hypothetical protein
MTQPTEEFRDWFGKMADIIAPHLRTEVAEGRQIPPILLVFSPRGEMATLPVSMATLPDKDATFHAMKQLAKNTGMVHAVVLVTEAWVVQQERVPREAWEDAVDRYRGQSLEHVPGRQEVVMLSALSAGMQLMAKAMIDRRNDLAIMGPFEHDTYTHYKGRLALDDEEE